MQRLQREQSVFHEGDPAKRVFMVTHGALKLYTLLADGRRQITGFMFPGDFLGVSVDEEYAFTVEALEQSELWWFSRDSFERFLTEHPSVERELYRMAAHELAEAQRQIVLLGRKAAHERLASFFLSLFRRAQRASGVAVNTLTARDGSYCRLSGPDQGNGQPDDRAPARQGAHSARRRTRRGLDSDGLGHAEGESGD